MVEQGRGKRARNVITFEPALHRLHRMDGLPISVTRSVECGRTGVDSGRCAASSVTLEGAV
jgi:hypothetical protein